MSDRNTELEIATSIIYLMMRDNELREKAVDAILTSPECRRRLLNLCADRLIELEMEKVHAVQRESSSG